MKKLPDWLVRTIKTFVQAFGGVAIPEICALLQNPDIYKNLGTLKAVLIPILCSALAAGICAAWNIAIGEEK